SYDALSRIEKVNGTDGRTVSYEYDAMGRATKVSDGDKETLYTYTATGRLKSVVDALSNETVYTYDALDNLKSIHRIDGRADASETKEDRLPKVGEDGHVTIYSYNLAGQLTEVTDALGQKETYRYDQYGRLVTKVDRDNYSTAYSYNDLGKVTRVDYADGKSVALSYDELGRLNEFTDWLGTTSIQRDILGRVLSVNDYNNKSVSYYYGKLNERTEIVYPDGRTVDYIYDDERKLRELVNGNEKTSYDYDEYGRLIEKTLPNGNAQKFDYFAGGMLKSLEMYDSMGLMDRYTYGYDNKGNRTKVNRFRRDLDNVSGEYIYGYDLENRLTEVSLDGELIRKYEYDAFGNRSRFIDNDEVITYSYDNLDRLLETVNSSKTISYEYDRRGNKIAEFENGILEKRFSFDATNMLSKVEVGATVEATYSYNGMGKRVAVSKPDEQIEFLLDLTKDYHNMLERSVNGEIESYIYDSNVVSMSKSGENYFYMLDELGTGMYLTGTDGAALGAFAYDEFGRTVNPKTGKRDGIAYNKNGNIIQPLVFTGYQHDEMTDSYFAQARYYDAEVGRFVSEDKVRGYKAKPDSINHYLYCWNRPANLVDLDGRNPTSVSSHTENSNLVYIYYTEPFEEAAEWQKDQLEDTGMNVEMVAISEMAESYSDQTSACTDAFVDAWNDMPDSVNAVYIYSHGNERGINFGSEGDYSSYDAMTINGQNLQNKNVAADFSVLEQKNIQVLNLISCNGGHVDAYEINGTNPAAEFAGLIGDGNCVYAWDGSVSVGYYYSWYTNLFDLGWYPHLSNRQHRFNVLIDDYGYPDRDPYGLVKYDGYDKTCGE
ncbi:MAG: RHS repeat protein, partial [Pseudobutyrivibrio sp.]|nr:RHS repeat protein [Pseudobutyrivibrio sp.]